MNYCGLFNFSGYKYVIDTVYLQLLNIYLRNNSYFIAFASASFGVYICCNSSCNILLTRQLEQC